MKLLEVIKGDFAKLATLVRKTKMLNEIVIETLQKVCRDVALYEFKKVNGSSSRALMRSTGTSSQAVVSHLQLIRSFSVVERWSRSSARAALPVKTHFSTHAPNSTPQPVIPR